MIVNCKKSGFTIIELVVTLVILAILIVIAVPYLKNSKKSAEVAATIETLRNICAAEETFYANNKYHKYASLRKLARKKLLDSRFLKRRVTINGYRYKSKIKKGKFKIIAKPTKKGYPKFYVDESFVIKYANGVPIGSH